VVGLVWSNDPESYAGGSIATGRASHVRHVKGDDPDKKGYPGPPGWGLGVGLTIPSHKKCFVEKLLKFETGQQFGKAKVHCNATRKRRKRKVIKNFDSKIKRTFLKSC
jgi:hypothetical protein